MDGKTVKTTAEMSEREKLMEQLAELNLGFHPSGEYYCCASEKVADFIIADRARIIEECAKIVGSMPPRLTPMDCAESLRRAGRKD